MRRAGIVVALLMLLALTVSAQEQRGAIEGVVKDSSGGVLPGVTVEARSPSVVGVSTTVTDHSGMFRFPGLMPGVYQVTATLEGFNSAKVSNIALALGQVLKVEVVMTVGSLAETVNVSASAAVLDLKQNASSANIQNDLIERLPKGRDFSTVVTVAPGANQETKLAGISVDGASGAENRYYIDGLDTTGVLFGTSAKTLLVDVVDEVQVKSSGYNAEFGGAMGGVISVTTKTGSNAFHGSVGSYYTSDALTADPRPTLRLGLTNDRIAEHITYAKDSFSRWDPGFTLGGPIRGDSVWFFASYMPTLTRTDRTVTFRLNNKTDTFRSEERTHYLTSNVTSQISSKIRSKVSFNYNPYSRTGQLPAIDGTSNPAFDFPNLTRKEPNASVSASIDYIPSKTLYVSVRTGYLRTNVIDGGVPNEVRYVFSGTNGVFPDIPSSQVRDNGYSNIPSNSAYQKSIQGRFSLYADATYYASFAGQHALKVGVQFDRPNMDVWAGGQKETVTLYWDRTRSTLGGDRVRGQYGYYMLSKLYTTGVVSTHSMGLFLQDSWTVNRRLTINAGIRTEQENLPSFIPEYPGMKFTFAEKLAPRIGFAWDVVGNGRWKAFGSWGIFYDMTKMGFQQGIFGGEKLMQTYYTLDTADWTVIGNALAGGNCSELAGTCPGTLIERVNRRIPSNTPELNLIDPNVKPMSSRELTIGLEHELDKVTSLGFRYVRKRFPRVLEDVGVVVPGLGYKYYVANPGYGVAEHTIGDQYPAQPKAERHYDALELKARRRLTGGLAVNASYVWSRLWGNYTGLVSADEEARVAPNATRNFDAIYMSFDQNAEPVYGLLPTDRPHQFKAQVTYDFKFGTMVGTNYRWMSGIPVSRTVPQAGVDVYYLGRASDGRTPGFHQTDLFLSHRVRLGASRRVDVNLNVLNLFDQKIVTNIFKGSVMDDLGLTDPQFFQGFNVDQIVTQRNLRRDPRFLKASAFQAPRAITVDVRFVF